MRKLDFKLKGDFRSCPDKRYNFTEERMEIAINEISESIRKDIRLNEIREAESLKYASKFFTTT